LRPWEHGHWLCSGLDRGTDPTGEQTLDLQLEALQTAGCGKVYQETASGAKAERPVLAEVLGYLRPGDILVVWRLDRQVVALLGERGIGF
jgi:hypothetical protein